MSGKRTAPRAEEFAQSARHVLFVEGGGQNAVDPQVLAALLGNTGVSVQAMGPSYHVASAAEALHEYHPDYYFLVDRDHHDRRIVEKSWRKFPDPATSNLLIWRRRELENYFLIPEYLEQSQFLSCTSVRLRNTIRNTAQTRIFLDVANLVITRLREELKKNWIKHFSSSTGLETKEKALKKLLNRPEFGTMKRRVAQKVRADLIERTFKKCCKEFLGDEDKPEFGAGGWMEMISGKHVLPKVINHCFRVRDTQGRALPQKERPEVVLKDLLRKPLADQPDDFQELHRLISERVNA